MYILSYQIRTNENDSDFILHSSKWLRNKSQVAVHPGKEVEERGHFSIVAGSTNLYSLFGNQFVSFSENWKYTYLKAQVYHS